jgi:uncharacterized protein (TIGR02246 family)
MQNYVTPSTAPSSMAARDEPSVTELEPDMPTTEEAAIQKLLSELADAWNRGDAQAYGARYRPDSTFTNVNGTFHAGRDEFNRRHEEIFRGFLKGTTLELTTKELRFIRPDVAVVDIDVSLSGVPAQPPGVPAAPDGALHTCLLMVLVKEGRSWWIAAYHNVWRSGGG